MCKWCVRKGDGEREAHWQDEVRPKIMFPSPQSYNVATMILIYLLSLGNWIAVKLVGRAAAIRDCGASKPTPRNAYYAFDMDVLAISDNVWTGMSMTQSHQYEDLLDQKITKRSDVAILRGSGQSSILLQ